MTQTITILVGGLAALLVSALLAGLSPGKLIDPGALLLVLGPLVGAVVVGFPPSLLRAAIGLLRGDPGIDAATTRRLQGAFGQLGQLAVLAAITGVLMAAIRYFGDLGSAVSLAKLITTSALCLGYGFGFQLLVTNPLETFALQNARSADPSLAATTQEPPSPATDTPAYWQRLLGIVLMVASWLLGFVLFGGHAGALLVPSKIILMITLLPLLLWMSSSRVRDKTETRAREFIDLAVRQADVALIAGLLGSLLGIMAVLESLQSPEKLGAGLAAASMGMLYGLMTYFALRCFRLAREPDPQHPGPLEGASEYLWGFLLVGLFFLGVLAAISTISAVHGG